MKINPKTKRLFIILGITLIFAELSIGIILYDRLNTKSKTLDKELLTCQSNLRLEKDYTKQLYQKLYCNDCINEETEEYVNSYYNFKLQVPKSWEINEFKTEAGVPAVTFTAHDSSMTVNIPSISVEDVNSSNIIDKVIYNIIGKDYQTTKYFSTNYGLVEDVSIFTDDHSYISVKLLIDLNTETYNDSYSIFEEEFKNFIESFSFIEEEENPLTNYIKYTMPEDWSDTTEYPEDFIELRPDFVEESDSGELTHGFTVRFKRHIYDQTKDLEESAEYFADGLTDVSVEKRTSINGKDTVGFYYCYEGCIDMYFVKKEDYLWQIEIVTDPEFDTKEKFYESEYINDVNSFLQSVEFKGVQTIDYP